ncbi:hypothetical protein VUR80DRAFT_7707 [Thermomyces stellatus]
MPPPRINNILHIPKQVSPPVPSRHVSDLRAGPTRPTCSLIVPSVSQPETRHSSLLGEPITFVDHLYHASSSTDGRLSPPRESLSFLIHDIIWLKNASSRSAEAAGVSTACKTNFNIFREKSDKPLPSLPDVTESNARHLVSLPSYPHGSELAIEQTSLHDTSILVGIHVLRADNLALHITASVNSFGDLMPALVVKKDPVDTHIPVRECRPSRSGGWEGVFVPC